LNMAKEILEKLFDSPVKVKLLKLFLRNPESDFETKEIIKRTKSDSLTCRTHLKKLEEAQLLKYKTKDNKKIYSVNPDFVFYNELKTLILKSSPASKQRIMKRLKTLGNVRLAVISGIFINAENSRVDFLLVGDRLNKKKLNGFFKDLEAEVGKEIDYVVLTGEEFSYRYNMFDRFLLDVLEKPHEKLINRLKI